MDSFQKAIPNILSVLLLAAHYESLRCLLGGQSQNFKRSPSQRHIIAVQTTARNLATPSIETSFFITPCTLPILFKFQDTESEVFSVAAPRKKTASKNKSLSDLGNFYHLTDRFSLCKVHLINSYKTPGQEYILPTPPVIRVIKRSGKDRL